MIPQTVYPWTNKYSYSYLHQSTARLDIWIFDYGKENFYLISSDFFVDKIINCFLLQSDTWGNGRVQQLEQEHQDYRPHVQREAERYQSCALSFPYRVLIKIISEWKHSNTIFPTPSYLFSSVWSIWGLLKDILEVSSK